MLAASSRFIDEAVNGNGMRINGFDIHRAFAEAVAWEDDKLRRLGRVDMRRNFLMALAATLSREDIVVVQGTGNAAAVASVIGPYVKRVVIANPIQVLMIAHAKIKIDTIDAGELAQLYASGYGGSKGRAWLSKQVLPEDKRLAIERHLREFVRLGEDLVVIERNLARSALADENVARLMAIPGVDMIMLETTSQISSRDRRLRAGRAARCGWRTRRTRRTGFQTGAPPPSRTFNVSIESDRLSRLCDCRPTCPTRPTRPTRPFP